MARKQTGLLFFTLCVACCTAELAQVLELAPENNELQRNERDISSLIISALSEISFSDAIEYSQSAYQAYQFFSSSDDDKDVKTTSAVFITNYLNRTLQMSTYEYPNEKLKVEMIPKSIGPGMLDGFTLESTSENIKGGVTWKIVDNDTAAFLGVYWGVFKDEYNYLIISIGSQELVNELSGIDHASSKKVKEYCDEMVETVFNGTGKRIKYCSRGFCAVGTMGSSHSAQISVQLYPDTYRPGIIDEGAQTHIPNARQLKQLLDIPDVEVSRCKGNGGAFICLSQKILLLTLIIAIFNIYN